MKKIEASVANNLARLIFKCKNEGCSDTIMYESILKHQSECGFQVIKCRNDGCDFQDLRKDSLDHFKNCQYKEIKCKWCNHTYRKSYTEQHNESCEMKPVKCVNKDCPEELSRISMMRHIQYCQYELVKCEMCKNMCTQKDIEDHKLICDYIELDCKGCRQRYFKMDIVSHEAECPEIILNCHVCSMTYKRKEEDRHTEIACLKYGQQILMNAKKQQDNIILSLQSENLNFQKKVGAMKNCIMVLFDLVHSQSECICTNIGDEDCKLHYQFLNMLQDR